MLRDLIRVPDALALVVGPIPVRILSEHRVYHTRDAGVLGPVESLEGLARQVVDVRRVHFKLFVRRRQN